MDINTILVTLMFASFIVLLFTGYPIALVLAGVSILFALIGYLSDQFLGSSTLLGYMSVGMITSRIYSTLENWILVALPMFIYMGLMLDRSGMAEKMLYSMQEMFGKVRGGLAVAVTGMGILLAASTGIIGASVVMLGALALPPMIKQGYSKALATGTVCASGTLGILIPPSVMLVMMADQLQLSVGDLFMGALVPGLLLGFGYIVYLLIYSFLKPHNAPLALDRRPFHFGILWDVFKAIVPAFALIIAVLGSIFAGIATITEASAVGALGATLIALFNRKLNLKILKEVIHSTFNIMAYIFAILIGASCFALVLRLLGGDQVFASFLTSLPIGPYGVLIVILLLIFFLGFFLDWIEITFIILPLIAPAIDKLNLAINGFGVLERPDMIWFTLLIAICLQTSFLTPPVGFAIFYLKGACPPEVALKDIYRGIIPFVIVQIIVLITVMYWPELVTWLPSIAYK
ncbi:MAG: TRAP transporter large permease subunit [Desulfatirhabdiaceae bacterium]